MSRICLNMIVKNESKIITRLLESVAPLIDCYCICDTGSTDNTVEVIRNFFDTKYPHIWGHIIHEPFRDFGYNRTCALRACESMNVKYILLLDADMILETPEGPAAFLDILDDEHNAYYMYQGSDSYYYHNVRIIRNACGAKYNGVTHEYLDTPPATKYKHIPRSTAFINDVGDGGCKDDKFKRDIMLLRRGLESEPGNIRYIFYLANSLCDAGEYTTAIETYKKRIEIGGWNEEVWYCYYRIGKCYKKMGDIPNAIFAWMEAFHYLPKRIESLYEIMHYYRCCGKNRLAHGIYVMAEERLKDNRADVQHLFYQKEIYDYKFHYEMTVVGYYCRDIQPSRDYAALSMKVLNCYYIEKSFEDSTLSNYKFYAPKLAKNINQPHPHDFLSGHLPTLEPGFYTSTPSVCCTPGNVWLVNIRHVNYHIRNDGSYENPGKIITKNYLTRFYQQDTLKYSPSDYTVLSSPNTEYIDSELNIYRGNEDVRLFYRRYDQKFYMTSNRGVWDDSQQKHKIVVEFGEVDPYTGVMDTRLLEFPGRQSFTEKNWVLLEDITSGSLKVVYQWYPLVLGDIVFGESTVKETHCIKTPKCFDHVRGSTNGVLIDGEWWFICHIVCYESKRHYYHLFVVLDPITYRVKRYSQYFTFEGATVEYTLGFSSDFVIGYSVMDRETKFIRVSRAEVDALMIENETK